MKLDVASDRMKREIIVIEAALVNELQVARVTSYN